MKHTRMGKLTRRALSLLFALTLLWECGALTPKARAADVVAADGTVTFVMWEKVPANYDCMSSCNNLCVDKAHPILLSYKSDGTEYFICATKSSWRWGDDDYNLYGMPKVSSKQFDSMRDEWRTQQRFTTTSTYNSLWAQYEPIQTNAWTRVNGLVFNVSDGNDGPGEYLGPGKSYSGQTYGGHKVHDTSFVVRAEKTHPFRFNSEDGKFRFWNYDKDGDNEDIKFKGSTVVLSDGDKHLINTAFIGEVVNASALTHDFTVLADQATTMGRPVSYIPKGVTLRVASGGVLTVSGILLNDGKIVVEPGGLLVLRENSLVMPYHEDEERCGGISSAGTIVVEQNAKLLGGGLNGIYLTGGVVYNFGVMASENFTATKKLLINNQDSGIVIAGTTLSSGDREDLLRYCYLAAMWPTFQTVDVLKDRWYYRNGPSHVSDYNKTSYYGMVFLPSATVSVAAGAIYGNAKGFVNRGSSGDAGGMMKVFYHDDSSAYEVLSAPRGTLGYRQSDTSHTVTRREVVYAGGQIDTLRTQYEQMQNRKQTLPGKTNKEASLTVDTALTFEQYVEQYFRSQGLDLDEKVTVRDGVITTGGLPALTIPWNQRFSVVRESAKAAEQTPGFSTLDLYFVQRKCPAELGATVPLGG